MKKTENNNIIPGVIYEFTPEDAAELGAFFDPAASEISLTENQEELELIEKNLTEIDQLDNEKE